MISSIRASIPSSYAIPSPHPTGLFLRLSNTYSDARIAPKKTRGLPEHLF
jgi:hypothetical protein